MFLHTFYSECRDSTKKKSTQISQMFTAKCKHTNTISPNIAHHLTYYTLKKKKENTRKFIFKLKHTIYRIRQTIFGLQNKNKRMQTVEINRKLYSSNFK
jgi:hypothetical protein